MKNSLKMGKTQLKQILEDCSNNKPNEACGLLFGIDGAVEAVRSIPNADASPYTYLLDAREQLKAVREMRELGQELIGIYHSHIASEAFPSKTDIKLAYYPEAAYVIVSLANDEPVTRAFNIVNDDIAEIDLVIEA